MHVVEIKVGPSARRSEITIDGHPMRVASLGLALSAEDSGPAHLFIELPSEIQVKGWVEIIEPTIIERCAQVAEGQGAAPEIAHAIRALACRDI